MSANWKSVALTVLLAALASGGGAWLGAGWMMKRHEAPGLHDIVHRKLDLQPEQDARLDAIETRFAAQREQLEADVRAAVDHFHDAMGALQKATIAHVFEMRAVLTPNQARVFDREIAGALTQEPR